MRSPLNQLKRLEVSQGLLTLLLAVTASSACVKQSEDIEREGSSRKSSLDAGNAEELNRYGTVVNIEDVGDATGKSSTDDEKSLNDVLPECGVDDISDRDVETFSTVMKYTYIREINAGVAKALVPLTSTLNLRGTLAETTLDVVVEVGNLAGTINGAPVIDLAPIAVRAEELAREFRGPVTGFSEPLNSNYHKDWKGIFCSVPKSNKLKNTRNGYSTEVDFYPAYAPNISPIADRVRYEEELGDFKFFRVKATVTSTNNPILTKKEYEGTVIIEKIPNVRSIPADAGIGSEPFRGDTAYRVTNRFGTEDETLALGFHLWTEYYIDHGQRSFSNIIADVGDDHLMYFKGVYKGEATPTVKASYTADVKPILEGSCTSCHSSAPRVDLSSYAKAKANGDDLVSRVISNSMPPGSKLSQAQKDTLKAWKAAGYPEN